MNNTLYYGDNLDILRAKIESDSFDLVYLDPPFNSQSTYNVLFHAPTGEGSQAQIQAFTDTWHWNEQAELAYGEVLSSRNSDAAEMLRAMRLFLRENDMMAYLTMMTIRLIELHRVLKKTGTIYLHCDPTASHYLKIILDAVFGKENFRNEISWRRSNPKSLGKSNFANCRDVILRYTKSDTFFFNKVFGEHDKEYTDKAYRYLDENGRRYRLLPLLNPNDDRPNLTYEFLGVRRVWRWTKQRMQQAYEDGLVVQLKPGAVPQYKKYLDASDGRTITNDWNDIQPVGAGEELGYPTQKPVALLERIVLASSPEDGTVLDPFCGCGTTIHAAQKLRRRWNGIDITHLAISLIERRLHDAFPTADYDVRGTPQDVGGAVALANADKYQFQWWAVSLVGAVPYGGKRKGADSGIDGLIYFRADGRSAEKAIVSVKGGAKVDVTMVRELAHVVVRENAKMGIFIMLAEPTGPMRTEAVKAGFLEIGDRRYPRIQLLTVRDLLRGKRPMIPLVEQGVFKKTRREDMSQQGSFL